MLEKFQKWLWPNVGTDDGISAALKSGALALAYYAVLSFISSATALVQGISLASDPDETNSFPLPAMLIGTLAMLAVSAAFALASALMWKGRRLTLAAIGLALIVWEIVIHHGLTLALPALPFVASGLRGILAAKGRRTTGTGSIES